MNESTIEKSASPDDVHFAFNISLRSAKIGENNITMIVIDPDGLSSNQTFSFIVNGIEPSLSSNDDINDTFTAGDNVNFEIVIEHLDVIDFLNIYYSIEGSNNWILYQTLNISDDMILPLNCIVNINGKTFSEGNHTIKVKLVDSNGLESRIYRSKMFMMKKKLPPPTITPVITQSPPPVILTKIETVINGVKTLFETYVLAIEIEKKKEEESGRHNSGMTPATLILLATIGFCVTFAVAYLALALYRRQHAIDSSDLSSPFSDGCEKDKTRNVTVVVKVDEKVKLDKETLENFKQEDLDYMFKSDF